LGSGFRRLPPGRLKKNMCVSGRRSRRLLE
jgi:hypothetical protein